jgi:hypothetical protein
MSDPEIQPNKSDRGSALIAAAIVAAAAIISWGSSDRGPRYQLAASGSAVVRMDTDSGAMIACDMQRCVAIEQPDRAKTLGPVTFRIGRSDEQPANEAKPSQ